MKWDIPFNRPPRVANELEYMRQALENGQTSGDGPFTKQASQMLADIVGSERVLLTTSCTHALEMAAILLNIGPGDEVIVPSFTFVSTVNAFVLRGARPVFCDVRPDTLNMDADHVERLLSDRTRAVVPVHYAGVSCDLERIGALAADRGVAVVEDNAHGLFGSYQGRPLGSIGALGTLSFHQTKNISCGEGGALLINDASFMERAEIVREKGTNRSRFFRGEIDKYGWVDIGSSYLPSDILAAALVAQLEEASAIQAHRRTLWNRYHAELESWAVGVGATRPTVPADRQQAYHMYYLLMPDLPTRSRFIAHLRARGILSVFHYLPLHETEMAQSRGAKPDDCPVTSDISDRLVRLPFFYALTAAEQGRVIEAIGEFS